MFGWSDYRSSRTAISIPPGRFSFQSARRRRGDHPFAACLYRTLHMRTVIGGMRNLLQALYEGLPYLEPQARKEQIAFIRQFEESLLNAADEEELMRIVVDGLNTLYETQQEIPGLLVSEGDEKPLRLAPIPDDLPNPNDPDRLFTIRDIFISDIRKYIPNNNHDKGSQYE